MSGTDHKKAADWGGPQPVFLLVTPQMGENIGAAARAMWNFGLEHMRVVDPRDGWPNPKAVAMASGAARVLDQVVIADTTAEAIGDLNYVYATTARGRDLDNLILTPEQAMADARLRIGQGQKVGVLFGPERAGLENEDIIQANALISVPVNPGYASLNLAQCVLLVAYEWLQAKAPDVSADMDEPAAQATVEALGQRMIQELNRVDFFWPEDKAASMQQNLRNFLSRMPMTEKDMKLFHGVIGALVDDRGKRRTE